MCPYGSTSGVASLCRQLASGASDFTTSTSPTAAQVTVWLTGGCAIIETKLTSAGYDVPPAATTVVYGWLTDLNDLWAASKAEMSRTNITLGPGERTRGQVFEEQFWRGMKQLLDNDLTYAGLSRTSTAKIYVGGVSQDDKDTWEDTTDRVGPRFFRGQYAFDETIRPDYSTSGS